MSILNTIDDIKEELNACALYHRDIGSLPPCSVMEQILNDIVTSDVAQYQKIDDFIDILDELQADDCLDADDCTFVERTCAEHVKLIINQIY